jgi:hypothetical protein
VRKDWSIGIDCFLMIICAYFYLCFNDCQPLYKRIIGVAIVFVSCVLVYKSRKDRFKLITFCVILYVNITIAFSDCFTDGQRSLPYYTLVWQVYRNSIYEIIFLKALFLFLCVVNLFMKKEETNTVHIDTFTSQDNPICFMVAYLIMTYGLVTGYLGMKGNVSSYVSGTTTLYEYCTLFFLIALYYSGKDKIRMILLYVYSIAYIMQAILYGDRSSAFPMVLLLVLLLFKKLTLKDVGIFSILGIFCSNAISIYRQNYSLNDFIYNYINRYSLDSIMSDTVSQSYYTGISLVAVKERMGNTFKYGIDYIGGIIFGGGYGNSNITNLGKQYALNKGGGLIISDFYFIGGVIGVIVLGIILSIFIRFLDRNIFSMDYIWKCYFTIMVFRWYLYRSFDLFRGVLFVFPVVFLAFKIIDEICTSMRKNSFL